MDGVEKRVFRRKHALLSQLLQVTPIFLETLERQGLLSADKVASLMTNPDKEAALLAYIEDATFSKVMFMLEVNGYDWVADEIFCDLQWERGKLDLEPYILQEATYVANSLLGERGFLNESRKQDLIKTIAGRHQVAKEAWKRQMARKRKRVVDEIRTVQQDILRMSEDVDGFLKIKGHLSGRSSKKNSQSKDQHVKSKLKSDESPTRGTSLEYEGSTKERINDQLKGEGNVTAGYGTAIKLLQERITSLSRVLEDVMTAHDKLLKERKGCFDIIGTTAGDEVSLDIVLKDALDKFSRELGDTKTEAQNKRQQVSGLDKQVRSLKRDLSAQILQKNNQVDVLQRAAREHDRMLRDAKHDLADMTAKRDICKSQADYWMDRCAMLEKTRRLGYYYISRFNQPVALRDPLPVTQSKRLVYYDPDLLEIEDRTVYIKAERPGGPTSATHAGQSEIPSHSANSKPERREHSGHKPGTNAKTRHNTSSSSNNISSNSNMNTSNNYNNNNNNNNNVINGNRGSSRPCSSVIPNKIVSAKSRVQVSKNNISFHSQSTVSSQRSSPSGQPVRSPYISREASTVGKHGNAVHVYHTTGQPQTLASGIYRPTSVGNSLKTHKGGEGPSQENHAHRKSGTIGIHKATQTTAHDGSTSPVSDVNVAKRKFEVSVRKAEDGWSLTDSGFSQLSSLPLDPPPHSSNTASTTLYSLRVRSEGTKQEEHCRCCTRCCKEAPDPYSHTYSAR